MKRLIATVAALVAIGPLVGPAAAQDTQTVYVHLQYMRVAPGGEAAYEAVERDVWRPVHEERRRRGELQNWSLYQVAFSPPSTPYDYVTVHVYNDLADLDGDGWEGAFQAAHPDADFDAMMARTMAAREMVHTEVWALVETIQAEGAGTPTGQYLALNFMDVPADGGAAYLATEREVWAPIHQIRTNEGAMGGWALYSIVFPRGEAMNYRFGTVDFFDDLDAAAAGITGGEIGRAHPESSQEEVDAMMEQTDEVRAIYKTELWSLLETLGPADG